MPRIARLGTPIQPIASGQPGAPIRSRFRRSSVPEIRGLNFSPQAPSYSPITNPDLGSEPDTSRQPTVEPDTTSSGRRSASTQAGNSQTPPSTQTEEIRRTMPPIQPPPGVDPALWNGIMAVATAFASVPRPAGETPPPAGNNNGLQPAIRSAEDVGYFDPDYEDPTGTDQPIVSSGRHNFYRDVYTFTDHLKDLDKTTSGPRVKELVATCLKGGALRWYNSELTEIEKDFFREATIERWCTHLIKRFKERSPVALKKLQTESYTYADARRGRRPRAYMQDILRYSRAADYSSVFHQCTTAWNNLELDFRAQIPEPVEDITLSSFLAQLDAKESVWMDMAARQRGPSNSGAGPSNNAGRANRPSKQNRGRQDGYQQQSGASGPQFPYPYPYPGQYGGWPPPGYTSYQFKNPAYQNQKNQYQSSAEKPAPAAAALPLAKQPLQLTSGSGSGSKNQARTKPGPQASGGRFGNRAGKARAYVADEEDELEDGFHEEPDQEQGDYHVGGENLTYYEPDSQDDEETVNFTSPVLAAASEPRCRHCKNSFPSNNNLHRHLRASCPALAKASTGKAPSPHLDPPGGAKPEAVYPAVSVSSTGATKGSAPPESTPSISPVASLSGKAILRSNVNPAPDVGTGYGFRGWNYAKARVSLSLAAEPADVCLDTGAGVSLVDRTFFKTQAPNTPVRTMASPLQVRGLGTNRHQTWEYAVCDIYLPGSKDGKDVISLIQREVHLVDNLKANMLIGNDITGPEQFIIDMKAKQATIGSIGASIPIEVRSAKTSLQRLVHLKKTAIIPPHTEMAIPVHNVNLPASRDFLFEPEDSELAMYAHLIDASTTAILVRNDKDIPVKIPRNYRLGRVSELDFPNAFHIEDSDDVRHLAIKEPKASHRDGWFKKLISACATAYVAATAIKAGATPTSSSSLANVPIPSTTPEVPGVPAASLPGPTPGSADTSSPPEIVLPNGVTIYHSEPDTVDSFAKIVNDFPALWHDTGFASMPEDKWMRIPLKSDWETRVSGKAKVYPLGAKDRELVDKTFDELHRTGKLSWTNESTPFSYPVFCVWKTVEGERKGRVVVDIRGLNAITQPDAYPLPLQADILTLVRDCKYISVIDCSAFFYQWRVHPADRHKLTVVSHRGQESFNVAVMGYKNSPAYVQRQIDRLLRTLRGFARAYVDDIVIFSHTRKEHESHLRRVFTVLAENNISIKAAKAFLGYPSVSLLGQKVDSFGLATSEEKLKAISKLRFPRTLRQLETYLGLTGWMRDYVPYYAGISKPLQDRKTELLRHGPTAGSARRSYSAKTRLKDPTGLEIASFETLQATLSKPSYLAHVDTKRPLFIDLDASKEFGFGAMLYYVKEPFLKDSLEGKYPPRHAIEPVLFLSRLVTDAESRYWPTELEIAGLVWVLKKTRHIVEASVGKSIIYTDHGAALGIASQTTLTTSSTDKLNLRLVRASDYIQRFNLEIRHKPGKQHIVPDALSRLASANTNPPRHDEGELDALFTASLVEMDSAFKQRILDGYKTDLNWQKIASTLDQNAELGSEGAANLPFYRGEDGLIFRSEGITTGDHAYEPCRLCIPHSVVPDILRLAHDDGHAGYARCFEEISSSYYIRGLSRYLRGYLKHCPQCQVYQTRRHAPYGSLQPILTPPIPFHTITIDFILALPLSRQGFDTAMSVSCKFSKRGSVVPGKKTWSAREWGIALLDRLDIADWGLPKAIISDRDRKFLSDMWTAIFEKLGVKLMYSTAYHPQTDGQSERTNQTIEIALRFYLATMENPADWPDVLAAIQRHFNNHRSAVTGKTPNEAVYGFTPVQPLSLQKPADADAEQPAVKWKPSTGASFPSSARARIEVADSIAFAQMQAKHHYDRKHQPLYMKPGDYAYIRLHHGYDIPATAVLGPKLSQQYAGPFKILEKVGQLSYRLDLPTHWRIHPVLSVAQLEPAPAGEDPYRRPRPTHPDSVFVEGDTELVKSFEIERLINKRQTARRGPEYLVRWLGYPPQFDEWRNLPELGDAMDLVHDYESAMQSATFLPGRLDATDRPAEDKPAKRHDMRKPSAIEQSTAASGKPSATNQSSTPTSSQRFAVVIRKPSTTRPGPSAGSGSAPPESMASVLPAAGPMVLRSARLLKK